MLRTWHWTVWKTEGEQEQTGGGQLCFQNHMLDHSVGHIGLRMHREEDVNTKVRRSPLSGAHISVTLLPLDSGGRGASAAGSGQSFVAGNLNILMEF